MKGTVDAYQSGLVYVYEKSGDKHIISMAHATEHGDFEDGHFIPDSSHLCPECWPPQ